MDVWKRTPISLILLLALAFDVTYGVVSYNTPYGCSSLPMAEVAQPSGPVNLRVFSNPCFYISYLGMLDGSFFVISLVPVPGKHREIVKEATLNYS